MSSKYRRGDTIRREVLGDAYVDAARVPEGYGAVLQRWVTDQCWDATWGREGLDRRTRSVVTLAVLAALGRAEEITTHTRGALRNGVTAEELAEIFIHVGTYAGVPSAVAAFRASAPVVESDAAERSGGTSDG